jgi:hypothetical protein
VKFIFHHRRFLFWQVDAPCLHHHHEHTDKLRLQHVELVLIEVRLLPSLIYTDFT